ncbi:MAG: aspartate carbamoyltransferase catalytic subunit [Myxococcota bacterium]
MAKRKKRIFQHRAVLGVEPLSLEDVHYIVDTARNLRNLFKKRRIKKTPALQGRTVLNLFLEPSTRTRVSFEIAEKRLSADIINIAAATSAIVKGESLYDTGRTLLSMSPDLIVIRHKTVGSPHFLHKHLGIPVINAGDGINQHPTQALLDLLTMMDKVGSVEGKTVTIVGDILHSRVARSNTLLLTKMGATVRLCGPPTLLPPEYAVMGGQIFYDLKDACEGANIIMMLRLQLERMKAGFFPSINEYRSAFCLTSKHLKLARKNALVMHPGPMNRWVEIAPDVADSENSVILDQVANGIAIRMALLYLLLGDKSYN